MKYESKSRRFTWRERKALSLCLVLKLKVYSSVYKEKLRSLEKTKGFVVCCRLAIMAETVSLVYIRVCRSTAGAVTSTATARRRFRNKPPRVILG